MMRKSTKNVIVPSVAGLVLALAGTALVIPAADASTAAPDSSATPHKGGTLQILNTSPLNGEAALDPASYYSEINIPELIFRSLTTYKRADGQEGTKVVPDLATDTGRPNADYTKWTYSLKPGVRFDDGTRVTSADIRYAVERTFEHIHAFGPPYLQKWLKDAGSYEGPLDGRHLGSITTPNDSTITFELASSHSDFPKLATLFQFSPVPQSRDDGADYHLHPAATGPYKVVSSEGDGQHVVLKRNPYWSQATDTERKAYPDTIDIHTGLDTDVINQRLLKSSGSDAAAITTTTNITPSELPRIDADPSLRSRVHSGQLGFTNFVALNPKVAPFDNPKVREAINYAIDRTSVIDSVGGSEFAQPATTFVPAMKNFGYLPYDNFPAGPTGNPDKARQLLSEAGYPNGLTITLYHIVEEDFKAGPAIAGAVQQALAKAGITVELKSMPIAEYSTFVYDSTKEPGAFLGIWSADYPGGNAMIEPIFDGREIVNGLGNFNFAQLNDPEVNAEIDAINKLPDTSAAEQRWGMLDKKIGSMALDVPLFHPLNKHMVGTAVKNVVVSDWTGVPDPGVIAVK